MMLVFAYLVWIFKVICLIVFLKYVWEYYHYYSTLLKIPGPSGSAILGNFHDFFENPDNMFNMLRQRAGQFYPIYKMRVLNVILVNLLNPEDIEQILSSSKHLSKSRIYGFLHKWLGTGLLTSTGSKWQTRRRILTPAFHFNILQQFVLIFNEETEEFVNMLRKVENQEINIYPHVTLVTLKSIMETAMGSTNLDEKSQNEYREYIYKIVKIFFTRLSKPWLRHQTIYDWSPLGKEERQVIKVLHKFSDHIISEREKNFDRRALEVTDNYTDEGSPLKKKRLAMLDLLLSAKLEEGIIDNEGIREEVDTFLFEGHDTTAAAISLILMLLACHKDIQENVYQEILQELGDSKDPPSFANLQNLKYMERCIKEGLRIYPSVPFISRFCAEEYTTTTGYVIPKDAIVHMHIFDLHRNPEIYPEPEKFDPDRFLPENSRQRHPFAYIPFSAGPRNCIGQRFAILEMKAVLCGVLRNFILEPVDWPKDIEFYPDLVLRTKNGVKMKCVSR